MIKFQYSASEIAKIVNGKIEGNPDSIALKFSKIDSADSKNSLTFLSNLKYSKFLYTTEAAIILVSNTLQVRSIKNTIIRVKDPYLAFTSIVNILKPKQDAPVGIDSHTYVHDTAKISTEVYLGAFSYVGKETIIGKSCKIFANVYIGNNVIIGDKCILYPGVKIYDNTVIGKNVIIHAGAVIGADGFGFAPIKEKFVKIEHIGNVVIQDNVEIGANCTIDRAQFDSTLIREGVKLDNLVMVAHNVEIGSNTVIASQTGIAGSSKIGNNCIIAGQVGISGHLKIADNVIIGPQTGVAKNISKAGKYMGYPAMEFSKFARLQVILKNFFQFSSKQIV